VDNPMAAHDNNATGTLNALMAAKAAGVKRFVYAATSSAYGECEVFPQHEGLPTMPVSPYAVSKLAGENYCRVFSRPTAWRPWRCVISTCSAPGRTRSLCIPP
jgi:UDP-glucose 4-epimerase